MAGINAGNISGSTIYVKGFQNVARSYARVGKVAKRNLTRRLKDAAEPVRQDAQSLAPNVIKNLHRGPGPGGSDWSRVRIGATQKVVYIAPTERGRSRNEKKRRPNFKNLMLDRAYEPALEHNQDEVLDRLSPIFDDIQHAWRV